MLEIRIDDSKLKVIELAAERAEQYLSGTQSTGLYQRVQKAVDNAAAYSQQEAPYLTGTLSQAQEGVIDSAGEGGIIARVTTAPVINPIYGGRADIYGPEVHEIGAFGGEGRPKPWMTERVYPYTLAVVVPEMGEQIEADLQEIFA